MPARNDDDKQPVLVPSLEDLPDPSGKAVLVRATLDLPLGVGMNRPMASRRASALGATLQWLTGRGARVTVCGDTGAADADEERGRFELVRHVVEGLAPGVAVADITSGGGVSAEDAEVIEALVSSHDLFVNEAFQWSYLPLPSLMVPAQRLPSAAGRGLQHDVEVLAPLLADPKRPFVAVLGGDRSFLRLHGLTGMVLRADTVLAGGAMALPLLQAIGKQPDDGTSDEFLAECRGFYGLTTRVSHRFELPLDLVWEAAEGGVTTARSEVRCDGQVVDIGPETRLRYAEVVEGAGSVLWVGALGRVEDPLFAEGTKAVAFPLRNVEGPRVIGGDALVSLLDSEGWLAGGLDVVSATDAALDLVKNGDLPALAALRSPRSCDLRP